MSTQSHINVDRSMARVIESRGAGRYRFERFRAALILNDARFSSDALKPGQVLPDRILVRADGEEISLRRLTDGRPLVLVVGSLTCPLTISTLPTFSEMNRLYGDQVAFAFIYPGFPIGCGTFAHAISRHALIFAGFSRETRPRRVTPSG